MYACPACQAKTISFFRKWLSYPAIPAHCKQCDNYFFAHRASGGVGIVISAFGLTLSGFLAAATLSIWPVVIGGAVCLAFYIRHWHLVKLEPLAWEAVAAARKAEGVFGAAWLLLLIFN
jgi:hypothetical protein